MVNIEDFIKRLEIILDFYGLNASSFADKIGVQRSSLSHLLSGRNKPSLDFILKILEVFPEVDLYWILNGKGTFPKNPESKSVGNISNEKSTKEDSHKTTIDTVVPKNLFTEITTDVPLPIEVERNEARQQSSSESKNRDIDKIIIFYKDGTFKSYDPQ